MSSIEVVIPSYARHEQIFLLLRRLLPQVNDDVSICVIDNSSPVNYEQYFRDEWPQISTYISDGALRFVRNKFNIGMSGNFMRAFEECRSEWMWLLSDDDIVKEDAISIIKGEVDEVSKNQELSFVKFSAPYCLAKKGTYLSNINQYIDLLSRSSDYFNSFIFISNGVYRVKKFSNFIKYGYQYANTYVPHLMMMLYFLDNQKDKDSIYLSTKIIVSYVKPKVGYSYGFVAGLGVGAFKNLPFDLTRKTYKKLNRSFFAHNDYKVVIDLFYYCHRYSNMEVAKILSKNYYVQMKMARGGLSRVSVLALISLLNFPRVMKLVLKIIAYFSSIYGEHIEEIEQRYKKKDMCVS